MTIQGQKGLFERPFSPFVFLNTWINIIFLTFPRSALCFMHVKTAVIKKGAAFFLKYDLEKKKGFLEGQVLFEDAYRKNARLLSEIRLRSFRSNSEGGGSCF